MDSDEQPRGLRHPQGHNQGKASQGRARGFPRVRFGKGAHGAHCRVKGKRLEIRIRYSYRRRNEVFLVLVISIIQIKFDKVLLYL